MILAGHYITTWNTGSDQIITRCGVDIQTMSVVFSDVSNDDTEHLDHLDSEIVEVYIFGNAIQCDADQGELTKAGQQQFQLALEKYQINIAPPQKSTAVFVSEISVIDPDTHLPVDISVYKDSCGGMFGIDSSYLNQLDIEIVPNIFNRQLSSNVIILSEDKHHNKLTVNTNWQTQSRGSNQDEYDIYLANADDGKGNDITTGKRLKTYPQWLAS